MGQFEEAVGLAGPAWSWLVAGKQSAAPFGPPLMFNGSPWPTLQSMESGLDAGRFPEVP